MKESDHEGAQVVYRRSKLRSCSLFCKRFGIVFFFGGAAFGQVNQMHEVYTACLSGLVIGALLVAISKGLNLHIAAYDRRQEAIVGNIWQE